MRTTTLLLLVALMSACTTKSESELPIFNDITFSLLPGEHVATIGEHEKNDFQSYFQQADFQVPLFRCIRSGDYTLFLGIPYGASIPQLMQAKAGDSAVTAFESDSATYFYLQRQRDGRRVTEFSTQLDKNFIYLLIEAPSEFAGDSLFRREVLAQRFQKKS